MSKMLVAYFSQSGNTRRVAETIAGKTGAEIVDLSAATPVSEPDVDIIFVGSPNWGASLPPQVKSFLTSYDFTGKKLGFFVTHGMGGLGNIPAELDSLLPDIKKASVYDGNDLTGLDDWLADIKS